MELISHIAAIHLFKDLPEEHLDILAMILTDQVFRKSQLIFSEGDQANGFYVVISGRVKIFKLSMDGKEQILHIFGPGAPIGEVAVLKANDFPQMRMPRGEQAILFPQKCLPETHQGKSLYRSSYAGCVISAFASLCLFN